MKQSCIWIEPGARLRLLKEIADADKTLWQRATVNRYGKTSEVGLVAIVWYVLYGHAPADVQERRRRARWYTTKRHPSVGDMLAKLRRTIIATQYLPTSLCEPNLREIDAVRQAWAAAGL